MTTSAASEATVTDAPLTDDVLHQAESQPDDLEVVDAEPVEDNSDADSDNLPALVEPGSVDEIAAEEWDHDTIEFMGDTLHVRKPTTQMLHAYSLSQSRFVKPQKRNDMGGNFITNVLSDATYDRVISRMMDPDDPEYTEDTIGDLVKLVVEMAFPPAKTKGKNKNA